MDRREHWERIWRQRQPDDVSWFQAQPEPSLGLIRAVAAAAEPVIDVGAGASGLPGALLDAGYEDVTVLDVSESALERLRERIGAEADALTTLVGDVLDLSPRSDGYAVWHDRAVFHFFTEDADRARYLARLRDSVRPRGHAIVATFAPDGPETCSGLPVRRQSADELFEALGEGWERVRELRHVHVTPGGGSQPFTFVVARRSG